MFAGWGKGGRRLLWDYSSLAREAGRTTQSLIIVRVSSFSFYYFISWNVCWPILTRKKHWPLLRYPEIYTYRGRFCKGLFSWQIEGFQALSVTWLLSDQMKASTVTHELLLLTKVCEWLFVWSFLRDWAGFRVKQIQHQRTVFWIERECCQR